MAGCENAPAWRESGLAMKWLFQKLGRLHAKNPCDALKRLELKVWATAAFDVVPCLTTAQAGTMRRLFLGELQSFAQALHLRSIERHIFQNGYSHAKTLTSWQSGVHADVDMSIPVCTVDG